MRDCSGSKCCSIRQKILLCNYRYYCWCYFSYFTYYFNIQTTAIAIKITPSHPLTFNFLFHHTPQTTSPHHERSLLRFKMLQKLPRVFLPEKNQNINCVQKRQNHGKDLGRSFDGFRNDRTPSGDSVLQVGGCQIYNIYLSQEHWITLREMTSTQPNNIFTPKYMLASLFASYIAGITHPLELIKTRFQSHDGKVTGENLVPKYTTIRSALKNIYQTEGFKGLYKGFYISLLCQGVSMSFFFWHYQNRKSSYQNKGLQTMDAVTLASIEASILTTFITQPIWVVRTRMLLNVNKKVSEFQNTKNQVKEIMHQHGPKGLLKGLQLSMLLSFSGVIQMYVYEGAKILYDNLNIPASQLNEKHFICGSLSKVFSVLLSYPITTMRTRIQQNQFVGTSRRQKYGGVSDLFLRTAREEGVRGFYKGISANLMRGVGQKGLYFYFYEIAKGFLFPKRSELV